jgi:hypothetical protein
VKTFVLAILLTFASLIEHSQAADTPNSYEVQTVRIASPINNGRWLWHGSGVLVSEGVLTAEHVIHNRDNLHVVTNKGVAYKVSSWQRMPGDAVVIYLNVRIPGVRPVPVGRQDITVPTRAICLGYWGPSFSRADPVQTTGLLLPNGNSLSYLGTLPLEFGMSGGPVIVNGNLVALVQGKDKDGNFYTKVTQSRIPPKH